MAKETINRDNLKLIYVHKIGYNYKKEALLEFIFSKDETNIDADGWGWKTPSSDSQPPDPSYVDEVFQIKIDDFDIYCLHEDPSIPYMKGYNLIHALAYETESDDDMDFGYGDETDELPILVFHYGNSYKKVETMLNGRGIQIKNS